MAALTRCESTCWLLGIFSILAGVFVVEFGMAVTCCAFDVLIISTIVGSVVFFAANATLVFVVWMQTKPSDTYRPLDRCVLLCNCVTHAAVLLCIAYTVDEPGIYTKKLQSGLFFTSVLRLIPTMYCVCGWMMRRRIPLL